jgi:hypothetical protein
LCKAKGNIEPWEMVSYIIRPSLGLGLPVKRTKRSMVRLMVPTKVLWLRP